MRGLFSFLFGASTLLVIERAEAAGESAAAIHYARMFWLLVFGLAPFLLHLVRRHPRRLRADRPARLLLPQPVGPRADRLGRRASSSSRSPDVRGFGASAMLPQPLRRRRPMPTRRWSRTGARCRHDFAPLAGPALADKFALFRGPGPGLVARPADRPAGSSRFHASPFSAGRRSATCCSAWRR